MEQLRLTLSRKTSPEPSAAIMGATFKPCSSRSQRPIFQCLEADVGPAPEWCEGAELLSPGGCLTPSIGEFPSVARESSLSEVLEADAPRKYYLSPTACRGILRRAERRGKELPEILREALEAVIVTTPEETAEETCRLL